MIESLVIDKIITILENNYCSSGIGNMTVIPQDIRRNESIDTVEKRLKHQINRIVLQFGITETLIRVHNLQKLLETLSPTPDIKLLKIGAITLYDRLKGYYVPIVYYHLLNWLLVNSEAQITPDRIAADLKKEPYSRNYLLGITNSSLEQLNIYGNFTQDMPNETIIAVNIKNKIKSQSLKQLQSFYPPEELRNHLYNLFNQLNCCQTPETSVFIQILLHETSDILKSSKKATKGPLRQLKLPGF